MQYSIVCLMAFLSLSSFSNADADHEAISTDSPTSSVFWARDDNEANPTNNPDNSIFWLRRRQASTVTVTITTIPPYCTTSPISTLPGYPVTPLSITANPPTSVGTQTPQPGIPATSTNTAQSGPANTASAQPTTVAIISTQPEAPIPIISSLTNIPPKLSSGVSTASSNALTTVGAQSVPTVLLSSIAAASSSIASEAASVSSNVSSISSAGKTTVTATSTTVATSTVLSTSASPAATSTTGSVSSSATDIDFHSVVFVLSMVLICNVIFLI